jgi:hypothetical protein
MSQDLTGWLVKRDAARLLGVAEKTVERLAARGEIQKGTRKRPGSPSLVCYHPGDLEAIRQKQEAAARPSAFPVPMAVTQDRTEVQDRFLAALETLLSRQAQQPALPAPPAPPIERTEPSLIEISVKLVLKLSEAQRLTGIPRSILLEAIRAGKLKADDKRWGRGWRMKRSDLEFYIADSQ